MNISRKNIRIPYLKQLLFFLFILGLTYLLLLPHAENFCHQISRIDFDTQNLFLWDHLAEMDVKPYKDTFYPYGLLFFNKSQSYSWFLIYILICPLLFSLIYYCFINRLFSNLLVKLFCYLGFITLVLNTVGIASYSRYGLIISGSLLSVWLIQTFSKRRFLMPLLVGMLSGLVSFASGGEGLYLLLVQIMLISLYHITHSCQHPSKVILPLLRSLLFLGLGVFLGSIPLLIYLFKHQLSSSYFLFYQDMIYLSELAKIPYTINTFHEIFIIFTLITGIISLLYLLYHPKYRLLYSTHVLAACVMCLLLMQQKNIIRSFGIQMDLYALMVILALYSQAAQKIFHRQSYVQVKTLLFMFLIFYCLIVSLKLPFSFSFIGQSVKAYYPQSRKQTFNLQAKLCHNNKINWSSLQLPSSYDHVIEFLENQEGSHSFVTYPYDPIFYLLGNQPPMTYPNAYEAAFLKAQEANLRFLKENNIQYLIYSPPSTPIDWAPDYVRTLHLSRYLLTQYSPIKTIEPFTIFKYSPTRDNVFTLKNSKLYPQIYDYFTKIWWQNLPLAEGQKHARQILANSQNLGLSSDLTLLNSTLKENPQPIANLYLIFSYDSTPNPQGQMTLTNTLGQSTIITYNIEASKQHLIIPANLPLFWEGGEIISISMNPPPVNLWLAVNSNIVDTWQ